MLSKAYAKINISLDVIGKREDGYHLLRMIMQNVDLYDIVTVEKCDNGISLSCDKEYVPVDGRNTAYKAAEAFKEIYHINSGVSIKINKNIPVSAGLAGGSTDAAAVLKAMRTIFKPEISNQELMDIGAKIGADIPYCITGGTALCEGIGEKIKSLEPFKDMILVLVKPPFGVSTREVYQRLDINRIKLHPPTEALMKAIKKKDLKFVAGNMKNVLENVTVNKYPVIRKIKSDMLEFKSLGSMMSGSGPTVFGFFDDMLKAQRCYDYMKLKYKDTFITRTI